MKQHLLFVCSKNRWRSLTAEMIFSDLPGYEVRSAGTENGARIKVSAGLVGWADIIFVMEKKHARRLREKFAGELYGKQVITLYIADDYQYMDEELIAVLESAVGMYIDVARL